MKATSDYVVRPFVPEDEPRVLDLLDRTVGPPTGLAWTAEFFRWKHLESPFGPSFMMVAERGDSIIGLRAFLRWEFEASGRRHRAVRAVDTATDPAFQGRGVFRRLTLEALDALTPDTDFVFNTPNEISLAGYLRMGWHLVSRLPIYVRPALPFGRIRSTEACDRFRTIMSREFVAWRYERAPLGYETSSGGVVYRTRPRGRLVEARLAELAPHASLRGIKAHYLVGYASDARPLLRAGFLPVPRRFRFAVRPLRDNLEIDPAKLANWSLTLGDLEVF